MISIGNTAPNSERPAPMKGTIPINATWDQYLPVIDEDGLRLDLTDYEFEIVFRDRCGGVALRVTTSDSISKTTDGDGDVLHVLVAPSLMSSLCGSYNCSFAAKNTDDQVWLLACGSVVFLNHPAAFT